MPVTTDRDRFRELLDTEGFQGRYDFVYVRGNLKTKKFFGYGIVNFFDALCAEEARAHFAGFGMVAGAGALTATWTHQLQGLLAHVEHFRNKPTQHPDMPDQYKPLLLKDGVPVPFPAPTMQVARPKNW